MWLLVGTLGVGTLFFFAFILKKASWKFDASLLGLFIFAMSLVIIAIIRPDSMKWGEFEIKIKEYAKSAKRSEELADKYKDEAERSSKLAMETMAMLLWNQGRWGGMEKEKKEIVIEGILKDLWGNDAEHYKKFMMKKGFYLVPESELEKIPETEFPKDIDSPFYQRYLKKSEPK